MGDGEVGGGGHDGGGMAALVAPPAVGAGSLRSRSAAEGRGAYLLFWSCFVTLSVWGPGCVLLSLFLSCVGVFVQSLFACAGKRRPAVAAGGRWVVCRGRPRSVGSARCVHDGGSDPRRPMCDPGAGCDVRPPQGRDLLSILPRLPSPLDLS